MFDDDRSTPDRAWVRDYAHVKGLRDASLHSLRHLERNSGFAASNPGSGKGNLVTEVFAPCRGNVAVGSKAFYGGGANAIRLCWSRNTAQRDRSGNRATYWDITYAVR